MTRVWRAIPILLLAGALSAYSGRKVYQFQGREQAETISQFLLLPSPAVQAISLEFKGVVSDYLFFNTMTFMGQKIGALKNPSRREWRQVDHMLVRVTDLDPRFWDPYLFAETMLAWQARMLEPTNQLLAKAARYLPWNYQPLYFLGFNHFYFKKEAAKAAGYLRAAAQRPGAPAYLEGLAARFSLYGNQTAAGIFFLHDMIRRTSDPAIRHYLQKRLAALEIIAHLEKKVQEFKKEKKRLPRSVHDLIEAGLLDRVPKDPYGGTFVILNNGRVYTTSKLVAK